MSESSLTVVLPTYNERQNVEPLVNELAASARGGFIKRVVYVDDDSPDRTAEYIKSQDFPLEVLCIHRLGRQGLSSAVIEGGLVADTEYVAVMDADGQHAPSDLMKMLSGMQSEGADICIGSRFLEVPGQASHSGLRAWISMVGNKLSNVALGLHLSDPLTGFFIIKRSLLVEAAKCIRPSGFKILLDVLYVLRKKDIKVIERQIVMRQRLHGESKLDTAVMLEFVEQVLSRLTGGLIPERFLWFSVVGGSGVFVHLSALYGLLFYSDVSFLPAQALSTFVAMVWNYTINNRITFRRNRRTGAAWFSGLIAFVGISSVGAVANVGVAGMLNSSDFTWWISGLSGVFVGIVFNFSLSRFFVWR